MKIRFFLIILFMFSFYSIRAQNGNELTNEQKQYITKFIYPISTYEPSTSNNDDLEVLSKFIGNSDIVGLGESTHGSSEVYKMKYRISQYLIKDLDFNIFSLEANMPESYLMNNYISKNIDSPKDILRGMYFWLWQTQETLNFVKWLKIHNENTNNKILFDGFDMQYYFGALKQVRDVYNANNYPLDDINSLIKILKDNKRGQKKYKNKIQKTVNLLLDKVSQKASQIKDEESKKRFLQNITIIRQHIKVGSSVTRDKFMAENVDWIKQNYNPSKVIVSAHNFHVSKENSLSMGYHINQKYQNNYVNFGFAFFEGNYTASIDRKIGTFTSQTAPIGSVEYNLNSLNLPYFILDLKAIKKDNNELGNWVLKKIPFRKTGSGTKNDEFRKTNIADSFDYLIFINKSSHSNLLREY
ncbi:erythromycin esterase family protein [Chryseobacterium gotjawalense]|uniref:Erythromycin esterase family protein n=1 Tax=Chryseobacterium gotjawalense TaxID=3042315 RepID=A0ABY8RCT7_9FLAO|nr:erythromycin esterase family protein [Chryseobacterium sp. wdc7]WHF51027.1 erythromycin esterase family protein [Chryseobacterium sp. wdc7]